MLLYFYSGGRKKGKKNKKWTRDHRARKSRRKRERTSSKNYQCLPFEWGRKKGEKEVLMLSPLEREKNLPKIKKKKKKLVERVRSGTIGIGERKKASLL